MVDASKLKIPAFLDVKLRFRSVAMAVVLSVAPVDKKVNLVEVVTSIPIPVEIPTTLNELVEAVVVLVAIGIDPVDNIATVLKFVGKVVIPLKFCE